MLTLTRSLLAEPLVVALSDQQRQSLVERFKNLLELCDLVDSLDAAADIPALLDEIELDAWVNIGAPEESGEENLSSWLVHVSWGAECAQESLEHRLGKDLLTRLGKVSAADSPGSLLKWIAEQSKFIRATVAASIESADICGFVAAYIALDVLVLDLVSTLSRARITRPWRIGSKRGGRI